MYNIACSPLSKFIFNLRFQIAVLVLGADTDRSQSNQGAASSGTALLLKFLWDFLLLFCLIVFLCSTQFTPGHEYSGPKSKGKCSPTMPDGFPCSQQWNSMHSLHPSCLYKLRSEGRLAAILCGEVGSLFAIDLAGGEGLVALGNKFQTTEFKLQMVGEAIKPFLFWEQTQGASRANKTVLSWGVAINLIYCQLKSF